MNFDGRRGAAQSEQAPSLTRLWVDTDAFSNPDDALAIATMVSAIAAEGVGIELLGFSTVDGEPEARAHLLRQYMHDLGYPDIKVVAGARGPLVPHEGVPLSSKKPVQWGPYERYEGQESDTQSTDGAHALLQAIRDSGDQKIHVLSIGRMTNLALAAELDPVTFSRIGGLYFQGGAKEEGGRLVPDTAAGNVSGDSQAAEKVFDALRNAGVPITVIGKHAGYAVQFEQGYFMELAQTGKRVGKFLMTHALGALEELATTQPDIYRRIFSEYIRPDKPDSLDPHDLRVWSFPYDAVAALAIIGDSNGRQHFDWTGVGNSRMVGVSGTEATGGVVDAAYAQQFLGGLIRRAIETSA